MVRLTHLAYIHTIIMSVTNVFILAKQTEKTGINTNRLQQQNQIKSKLLVICQAIFISYISILYAYVRWLYLVILAGHSSHTAPNSMTSWFFFYSFCSAFGFAFVAAWLAVYWKCNCHQPLQTGAHNIATNRLIFIYRIE